MPCLNGACSHNWSILMHNSIDQELGNTSLVRNSLQSYVITNIVAGIKSCGNINDITCNETWKMESKTPIHAINQGICYKTNMVFGVHPESRLCIFSLLYLLLSWLVIWLLPVLSSSTKKPIRHFYQEMNRVFAAYDHSP